MSLLQHMAMVTHNNRRLARFYQLIFGMEEVWNPVQRAPHAYYVGDGYFQINCLQIWSDITYKKIVDGKTVLPDPEINHIGFQVKSIKEIEKRFAAMTPAIKMEMSPKGPDGKPRDGRYEEWRFTDPDGNLFELAHGCWEAGKKHDGTSPAAYVGINSPDPDRLADFYTSALDLKEVNRANDAASGARTVYLSDGKVCFAISGGKGVKAELTSLGFKVQSIKDIRERLKTAPPILFPGEPPFEVMQRPASSPYKASYMKDPDGNGVELSEEGWG